MCAMCILSVAGEPLILHLNATEPYS